MISVGGEKAKLGLVAGAREDTKRAAENSVWVGGKSGASRDRGVEAWTAFVEAVEAVEARSQWAPGDGHYHEPRGRL